jgi:hypothetical protein
MMISPNTMAPEAMVTLSPIVGQSVSLVYPMVTCWLIQQFLPILLAAITV